MNNLSFKDRKSIVAKNTQLKFKILYKKAG